MTSQKQRAANKVNALKSTGPKSIEGRKISSANSTKHSLSLPVDERLFADEIQAVANLIRGDCESDHQAIDLAKRIIDYERNETFLILQSEVDPNADVNAWGKDPLRFAIYELLNQHKNKKPVSVTFTTSNLHPKGQERTDEIKYLKDLLKLFQKSALSRSRYAQVKLKNGLRYQKRAINQLVKGVQAIACGQGL